MRSEVDKANVRLNRKVNTFKKENCDVWQDRPQLVSYEICPQGRWLTSVHHLTRFEQIVQVTPDEGLNKDEAMAQLIFYSESSLYELERIRVPMEHYEACTIVNESAAYKKGYKGFEPDVCDTDKESEEEEEEAEQDDEGEEEKRSEEVEETVQEAEVGGKDEAEEGDAGPRYFFAVFYTVE